MKSMKSIVLAIALLVMTCGIASAFTLPTGTIYAPNTLGTTQYVVNLPGYDFTSNPYSLNLTTLGGPVTISGTADLSNAPSGEYYFVIKVVDSSGNELSTVMTTAPLGKWHGIPSQPWDRVSGEASYYDPDWNGAGRIEKWFSTQGGVTDSDYDGAGPGVTGDTIVPSDRIYGFEMTLDPTLETLALKVFANGITNTSDKQWYDLGFFRVDSVFNDDKTQDFNWAQTQFMAKLYGEDGSVQYGVPEPSTLLLLGFGLVGLAGARKIRRSRSCLRWDIFS